MHMDSEMMQEFVENLDGAAILDETGAYVYVSKNWEKYTGVTAGEALGKKVWDVIPDTHAREVYINRKAGLCQGSAQEGQTCVYLLFPKDRGRRQGGMDLFVYYVPGHGVCQ